MVKPSENRIKYVAWNSNVSHFNLKAILNSDYFVLFSTGKKKMGA
jgi:hypothetical protein